MINNVSIKAGIERRLTTANNVSFKGTIERWDQGKWVCGRAPASRLVNGLQSSSLTRPIPLLWLVSAPRPVSSIAGVSGKADLIGPKAARVCKY